MRIILLVLAFFCLFFEVGSVFAIDPPSLINPQNNSVIWSVPSFSWQAVSGSTGYNILIDDEPSIKSPYVKTPYYPTNPSYSPQTLNPGTYYWKVKTKDSGGNWSNFSSIWSFTLTNSTPSPTPTSLPTTTPTPTPSSSHAPPSSSSSFTISSIPSQINSDQSFQVLINLSLTDNPNTNFYLKGAFKKSGSSNYFGLTKVSGNWVKNVSNYSDQYPITTDSSGNWSGNLDIQIDNEDSGYSNSGEYIFKVAIYTYSGSGPTWSNESNIYINNSTGREQETSSDTDTTQSIQSDKTPSLTPATVKSSQIKKEVPSNSKNSNNTAYQIASIAGIEYSATPAAKVEIKNQKQSNLFVWVGLIFIFAGGSLIGYIIFRKNDNIHIKLRRRY